MKENDHKEGKDSKYHDVITYTPEAVKIVPEKDAKWAKEEKYYQIVCALRNKNLTAKEIHSLYTHPNFPERKAPTMKTIYRYLEKLNKADLVTVAGYRLTEGTRLSEKLYCRTAKAFLTESDEKIPGWEEKEKGTEYAHKLGIMLSESFEVPKLDTTSFNKLFRQFAKFQRQAMADLIEKTKHNKNLSEVFSETSFDMMTTLNHYFSMWAVFLRYPDLFEQLKELLKGKSE